MNILLTRPIIDSVETSKLLKENSWNFTIAPLLEIKKKQKTLDIVKDFDVIVFTSKNGIRNLDVRSFDKKTPVFTIGPGTKELAEKQGFSNIVYNDGELKKLKSSVSNFLVKGMKVLHPTFQSKNKELEDLVNSKGCSYIPLKCYDSKKKNVFPRKFSNFIRKIDKGIITLFSSRTAQSFYNEIRKLKLVSYCRNKRMIVLSKKIKSEFKGLKFEKIFVANQPNESSMFEILKLINREEN